MTLLLFPSNLKPKRHQGGCGDVQEDRDKLWRLVILMNLRPNKLRTPRAGQICARLPTHTSTTGCVMTDPTWKNAVAAMGRRRQQDYMFTTSWGTFWTHTQRPLVHQCDLPLLSGLLSWPPHFCSHRVTTSECVCELCEETSKRTMWTAIWY